MRTVSRGAVAFCLTEPIPYVGVDTGMLNGKIRIVEWKPGEEPILQVEKRGRFITNIDFANFVTAAVDAAALDTLVVRIASRCVTSSHGLLPRRVPLMRYTGMPCPTRTHEEVF